MKKIYSYAMLLLASTFALSSCSDDRDSNPVLSQPTEFKLNSPATGSGNVDLFESNSVQLTWSQPAAVTLLAAIAFTSARVKTSVVPEMAARSGRCPSASSLVL